MAELSVDDEELEYEIVESSDATKPRIDVDIHRIKVVVPEDSTVDPQKFIEENSDWVLDKKHEFDDYRDRVPDRSFEEGAEFPYTGDSYTVEVEDREEARVEGDRIVLPVREVERDGFQDALESFYRDRAEELFTEHVECYAEEMDVEYESVTVRNQRTRWGSCSPKQNLSFNWRLTMAPEEVLEYVVVHELAHLIEKNHTDKYWRVVQEYMPDYKEYADWLEENSPKLVFTEDDL